MADIISLLDVKRALRDSEFRKELPSSLLDDVQKFLNNPVLAMFQYIEK